MFRDLTGFSQRESNRLNFGLKMLVDRLNFDLKIRR